MRKFLVGGNWKMNGDSSLVASMSDALNSGKWGQSVDVVVAPPFHLLASAKQHFKTAMISAQNCSNEKSGAFTGEISVDMLKDIGISWVILGHSERREIFKESDDLIGKKVAYAVKNGLHVIACIGEKLNERESGKTMEVCIRQLSAMANYLDQSDWKNIVIAYEPVWAIGTGKVATPAQAEETHAEIRSWLAKSISQTVADETRILYGGSVNAKNCGDLQTQPNIDGFLVGGASLKTGDFSTICHCKL